MPKVSRRSHGAFVSEMPYEMEEEEERDEEDSGDDLDHVEKILNEDDEWYKKTRSERCWRLCGNSNDKNSQRRNCAEVLDDRLEELKLRTKCNRCGNVGHWAQECSQKRVQSYKESGRGGYSARKRVVSQENRERLISVTGAHSMNRVSCVSSRASTALCWTGFANAENSVVHCRRKRRNRELSVSVPLVRMKQC